jgi:molecular chaperone GrpE
MTQAPKGPAKIDLTDILSGDAAIEDVELDLDSTPEPEEAVAALEDRLLRLRAEFENYRKRTQREAEDMRNRAGERLVRELLPVIDNLDRALNETSGADDAFREGVELIQRQLWEVLSRAGLEPIDAMGAPFDPAFHEAVTRDETSDAPPNTVTDEVQKGYLFQGRLLRPAMVRVAYQSTASHAGIPPGDSADPASD